MLRSPSRARRIAGRLLIVTAAAAALPLTASHAVQYIDVPAPPAPVAPTAPVAPAATVAAAAGVQAEAVRAPRAVPAAVPAAASAVSASAEDMNVDENYVTFEGKRKRWEDLTPAERARVKAAVERARAALANTHIDQARIMSDLAKLPDKARIEEMRRQLGESRAKLAESVRRMDSEAAEARASGRGPDQLKAEIREELQSIQSVDFEAAARALAVVDRQKIAAEVAGAQQSMQRARAELDRIQARIDADQRH